MVSAMYSPPFSWRFSSDTTCTFTVSSPTRLRMRSRSAGSTRWPVGGASASSSMPMSSVPPAAFSKQTQSCASSLKSAVEPVTLRSDLRSW
jgi:hypothetical protein